ncbi:MAG: cytidine deaminase, partial [bacterium]
KAIIQSGIIEVVYLADKYKDSDAVKASKIMFDQAGVSTRKIQTSRQILEIHFDETVV